MSKYWTREDEVAQEQREYTAALGNLPAGVGCVPQPQQEAHQGPVCPWCGQAIDPAQGWAGYSPLRGELVLTCTSCTSKQSELFATQEEWQEYRLLERALREAEQGRTAKIRAPLIREARASRKAFLEAHNLGYDRGD